MTDNGAATILPQVSYADHFESNLNSTNDVSSNDLKVTLQIDQLACTSSPRLTGLNSAHARLLADLDEPLPPIVVQRSSMRVIDGMHRLEAARLRSNPRIEATVVNLTDAEAFVAAVKLNSAHGLPLSSNERSAATAKILQLYPEWSDRKIAGICGVAPRTVAGLRRCSTDDGQRLNKRTGRDGKLRPVSAEAGRRMAAEFIEEHPGATLREVARAADISPGTAMDVVRRLRMANNKPNGTQPTSPVRGNAGADQEKKKAADSRGSAKDLHEKASTRLNILARDPSLRYTQHGRNFLRLAFATLTYTVQPDVLAKNVPSHCRGAVSELAAACADRWYELARALRSQ